MTNNNNNNPDLIYKDFKKLIENALPIKIGALLVEEAHLNIETGQDIHGNRFVARKRRKRKKKSRRKRSDRAVLVDTGEMKNSVEKQVTGKAKVTLTAIERAQFHQEGGKHLPQREFIGVGERAGGLIDNKIESELDVFFAKRGFKKI